MMSETEVPSPDSQIPPDRRKNPMVAVRVVVLVVVAAVLGVYAVSAKRAAKEKQTEPPPQTQVYEEDVDEVRLRQRPVWEQTPPAEPGDIPPEEAEFEMNVWVDPDDGKFRLYYDIAEIHGYYADTFDVEFWYKDSPDVTDPEDSPLVIPVHINDFVKANDSLRGCIEIAWAELESVGGDMGTTENWDGWVVGHHQARLRNPDPLPTVFKATNCD